jgi:hypothetical protein
MKDSLENRTDARIVEWVGMCRHLRYDLAGAIKCYEECSENVSCHYYEAIKTAKEKFDSTFKIVYVYG